MRLWRIAADTRRYAAADMSGAGAAKNPGRWNDAGEHMIYTAESISLAVLETAAHIDDKGMPLNRVLLAIDVPDETWDARERIAPGDLPVTWAVIPAGQSSVRVGSQWLAARRSPILLVPSVIVPEEPVVLINPAHPANAQLRAQVVRTFEYDRLFRS